MAAFFNTQYSDRADNPRAILTECPSESKQPENPHRPYRDAPV